MIPRDNTARIVTLVIMGAVALWGAAHAMGAYRLNHNPWRSLVVLACVAAFLGLWLLSIRAMRSRAARTARRD